MSALAHLAPSVQTVEKKRELRVVCAVAVRKEGERPRRPASSVTRTLRPPVA